MTWNVGKGGIGELLGTAVYPLKGTLGGFKQRLMVSGLHVLSDGQPAIVIQGWINCPREDKVVSRAGWGQDS